MFHRHWRENRLPAAGSRHDVGAGREVENAFHALAGRVDRAVSAISASMISRFGLPSCCDRLARRPRQSCQKRGRDGLPSEAIDKMAADKAAAPVTKSCI